MARDPPSTLDSTELRDISLTPSAIRSADITIIHPQLRDLIVPLSRGRVLYPKGYSVEEAQWPSRQGNGGNIKSRDENNLTNRIAFRLNFAPNCLVADSTVFACGGQHGELFVTDLPAPNMSIPSRFSVSPTIKPFIVSTSIPNSRSINNSIIIAPSWPKEWSRQATERTLGYLGRGSRSWDEIDPITGTLGRAENGQWITRAIPGYKGVGEGLTDADETSVTSEDEDEVMCDMNDSGLSPAATYPNTLPVRSVSSHPLPQPARVRSKDSRAKEKHEKHRQEEPSLIISSNDRMVAFYRLRCVSEEQKVQDDESIRNQNASFARWVEPAHLGGDVLSDDQDRRTRNARSQDSEEDIPAYPPKTHGVKEERTLHPICKTRFPVAANHSSLSPDLKHLISVGDSTDVNIFEVSNGGRDLQKIAVYSAGTDACFSSAWSKDGRKFAVASQDGQVTVWDHRSSRPLALFHTSPSVTPTSTPSSVEDVTTSYLYPGTWSEEGTFYPSGSGDGTEFQPGREGLVLRDPVTGAPRAGRSTSGREAARVVKFSPEGSDRDLMVFSEENSNIHIIDARTFSTHVVVPVPHGLNGTTDSGSTGGSRRGVEGGTWGISGLAFEPTGNFLYAATEATVVEWDVRRLGGQGGTWSLC